MNTALTLDEFYFQILNKPIDLENENVDDFTEIRDDFLKLNAMIICMKQILTDAQKASVMEEIQANYPKWLREADAVMEETKSDIENKKRYHQEWLNENLPIMKAAINE